MEYLNEIIIWVSAILGGVSVASIISLCIWAALKGAFKRAIQKIDIKKQNEEISTQTVEKMGKVVFKQNIQPIVESEITKANEARDKKMEKQFAKLEVKFDKLITINEKLAAYFDDSIVSDAKKKELKEAIEEAKAEVVIPDEQIQEFVIETKKEQKQESKKEQKDIIR